MGIEIESVKLHHQRIGDISSLHIGVVPLLSHSLIEVKAVHDWALDQRAFLIRARLDYNPLAFTSAGQQIWTIGDELRVMGQLLAEQPS